MAWSRAPSSAECDDRCAPPRQTVERLRACFEQPGLEHFEGRSRTGLHRHALMTMNTYAFPQSGRPAQRDGKKNRGPAATIEPAGSPASRS